MPASDAEMGIYTGAMSPELQAYYTDRPLMWRNIWWLVVLNVGAGLVFTLVGPLMQLRMNSKEVGMGEGMIATIGSINSYLVSYLVMYFSWKSDHCVSRWGRRIPYLWISSPGIIISVILFPYFHYIWILFGLMLLQLFFMDMKNSTISLLPIDIVPRTLLARTQSITGIVGSALGFFVMRYGMKLADFNEKLPYLLGGGVLTITALSAGLAIKEPPIRSPTTERFKPWSALKVGWKDRRVIVLMLGASMIGSFGAMYNTWIWLFAKNVLHLSRTDMGASMSWSSLLGLGLAYPYAWLMDRMNPYKLLGIFILTQYVLCAVLMHIHGANGLILVSIIWCLTCGFAGTAMLIVVRSAPHADVGSVTSSMAFINNAYMATLVFVSGQLIQRSGHNYNYGFGLGLVMMTIAYGILLFYRHLMRHERQAAAATTAAPAPTGT